MLTTIEAAFWGYVMFLLTIFIYDFATYFFKKIMREEIE